MPATTQSQRSSLCFCWRLKYFLQQDLWKKQWDMSWEIVSHNIQSYLWIRRLDSRYIIPLQICCAKSQRTGTVRNLTRRSESFRHSSNDRRWASSVTNIRESVERTTPYNLTMFSWSIECIMAASFRNSIGLLCILSRHRHFIATWILSFPFVQTPCWTIPNSPKPSCLFTQMASRGIICLLLGTFVGDDGTFDKTSIAGFETTH